jgi:hypothetical protein
MLEADWTYGYAKCSPGQLWLSESVGQGFPDHRKHWKVMGDVEFALDVRYAEVEVSALPVDVLVPSP